MWFFSFDRFITPTYIKVIFIIGLVGIALSMPIGISLASDMMKYSGGAGTALIFGSIIGPIVGAVLWRVVCEVLIVRFRIYDELRAMRTGEDIASSGPAPVSTPKPSWRTE